MKACFLGKAEGELRRGAEAENSRSGLASGPPGKPHLTEPSHRLPALGYVLYPNLGKPGQVYHPIHVKEVATPKAEGSDKDECIVQIYAAGLNHRDVWLRKCECLQVLGERGRERA